MQLKKILPLNIQKSLNKNCLTVNISDITSDSRKVKKGALFFALPGKQFDGAKFIEDAIKKGALAVVCSSDAEITHLTKKIILIKTSNPQKLLIEALNKFYPDLPKNIFAVTGTNGKTSTAEFTRQMLEIIGKKSASIGTLGVMCSDAKVLKKIDDNFLTTPDIVSLYKNLVILKKAGINDVAIEASSIGIEQGRLDGIKISVGIFSNFTQDHLDYHGSMENYFAAKMLLFSKLIKKGLAVINSDIPEYKKISAICKKSDHKIISYGKKSAGVKLKKIKSSGSLQEIEFVIDGKNKKAKLSALGDFQAYNALSALSAIYFYHKLSEKKLDKILQNFSDLKSALGRMQKIGSLKNGAEIFIDFAHTPDALENILSNVKKSAKARVLVLFGCGGDRDNKKRPIMGKIASDLADQIIITDDNPRTEKPEEIRKQILSKCDLKKTIEIPNRKIAIEKSIQMLKPDDILILAGKGHEKYQIIGSVKHEFDEEKIVKNFLKSVSSKLG